MNKHWTADALFELVRGFQPACVLGAAADLDLFSALATKPLTAPAVARKLKADLRALTILLDALTALGLLRKQSGRYTVPRDGAALLTDRSPASVLPMMQHQAHCLRRWSQLAETVRSGRPPRRTASVRGAAADYAAFIGAMHVINAPSADQVIRGIKPLRFGHLLDVGGASGTWTMAFLRACPAATATLFDLPPVLPLARKRLAAAGLLRRVTLASGDFLKDTLPAGADMAWVSAIVHQNSRAQNRHLFANVRQALVPGGRIAIRDILMAESRTAPVMGALFAVNMLVGTRGGGTFTLAELRADLVSAGFCRVKLARPDNAMDTVVTAVRSASQVSCGCQ